MFRMLKIVGKGWAGQREVFLISLLQGSVLGKILNLEMMGFAHFFQFPPGRHIYRQR